MTPLEQTRAACQRLPERLYINARVAMQLARDAGNLELAEQLQAYGGECVCFVNGKFDGLVVVEPDGEER